MPYISAGPTGVADALRAVAMLSIVMAGLLYSWTDALVLVVVAAVLWVPRVAALPRPVDLAIGVPAGPPADGDIPTRDTRARRRGMRRGRVIRRRWDGGR